MFSSTYRCTNTEQQLIWRNLQVKYYKPSALSGRSSEWVWYSTASEDGVATVGLHFVAECKSSDCSVFSRFMSDASSLLGRVTVQCSPCTTYLLSAVCIATVGIQTQYFVSVSISETSDKSVRPYNNWLYSSNLIVRLKSFGTQPRNGWTEARPPSNYE